MQGPRPFITPVREPAPPPKPPAAKVAADVRIFSGIERRSESPTSSPPLHGARPQWAAALGHVYTQLAAGNELTEDHAQRVSRLFAGGAGTRSAAIRWWWVLRGECMPYGPAEATALVERDLWAQALHNARTVLLPRNFDADSFRRVALKTAAMALHRGQWGPALQVLHHGLIAAPRCEPSLPPKQHGGAAGATARAAGRMWGGELDALERVTVGSVVHRAGTWEVCLQAAAALSRDRPTRVRRGLELVALHRLARSDDHWWRALAYVDDRFRVGPHALSSSNTDNSGRTRRPLTRRVGHLAARVASERLGDARRVAVYVDALRRGRLGISSRVERRAVRELAAAGASGRSLAKLRAVAADGRKLEARVERRRNKRVGTSASDGAPAVSAAVTVGAAAPEPPSPPMPRAADDESATPPSSEHAQHDATVVEPAPSEVGPSVAETLAATVGVMDLDERADACAAAGDWVGALHAVAALQVVAGRPAAAGLPLTERAVLGSVRGLASWRDALALYAPPESPGA